MILASEEISRRNNLPVYLRCELWEKGECITRWCVEYAGRVLYAETFEDAVEYIKKKKLLSPKRIENIDSIKQDLLQKVERELKKLQHIEDIRNTAVYKGTTELLEIRDQLREDLRIPYNRDADSLIMLHYLKEIGDNLYEIIQTLKGR